MKHVVIVGAGFAGLNAAKRLGRQPDLQVTVIDRRNHHLFQPLLYQVAMAGLSPAEISVPIRSLLRRLPRVRVRQEPVTRVDLARREVQTPSGSLGFDYLVLGCGARDTYYGHDEWEEHAPPLKSIEQALEIRRRVLRAYEQAELETDSVRRKALLTFVVVGGGPTGVELAGALGEMSRFTLARDFRNIDPKLARVVLVEAGPRILPSFSEKLASRAMRDLESLGVQIWTSSVVSAIDSKGVEIGDERLEAATTVWAAGVRAARLCESLGVALDPQGRVPVEPDLSVSEHPDVFVVGDAARCADDDGEPLPGVAPVALQQGRHVAQNVLNDLRGRPREPFHYAEKGQLATIGRSRALFEHGKVHAAGFVAWLLWLTVHIFYLVGFKNRGFVVMQWAWAYLAFNRGARLIVEREWRAESGPPSDRRG